MKKILLLMVALTLVVGVASASSFTVLCGSVGSASGNSTFTGGTTVNGAGGTSSLSGGTATITCNSFLVPVGYTLVDIKLIGSDDAQQPLDAGSAVQWTWGNLAGNPVVVPPFTTTINQESSTGFSFGNCTTINGGDLPCDATTQFGDTVLGGFSTGLIGFTISSAAGGGDSGVGPTGNTSAQLAIEFDYFPNAVTPEPMTMMLVGGGLLGVGLVASKLRKRT
jgi:hypothetical protein